MKILICPDSFKGTLSAQQAAKAIERGLLQIAPESSITKIPLADGGHGTLEVMQACVDCELVAKQVKGPLGQNTTAHYLILDGHKAFIEMAQAAGLTLLTPKQRNPLLTTTYGVGELIVAALQKGCKQIVLGLGGSATNDCGIGMAQALGVRFLDQAGHEVEFRKKEGYAGGSLQFVKNIDISGLNPLVSKAKFIVASDVNNPLVGPDGASHVYGPQKGADAATVADLDKWIENFATILENTFEMKLFHTPGAGAAGGLGAGILAFLNGKVMAGVDEIMHLTDFENKVKDQELLITGEGRIDCQTTCGKTISGIAKLARKHRVPLIAIGGCLGQNYEQVYKLGIDIVYDASAGKHCSSEFLQKNASQILSQAAKQAFLQYLANQGKNHEA